MSFDWICESLRLTAFSTGTASITGEDWKRLTGQDEAEQEQKGGGRHIFVSNLMGGQLSLGALGNRCDCVLIPGVPGASGVPSLGAWPGAMYSFLEKTIPLLERMSFPVARVGFAPILLLPFPERLDAYKALTSLVKSIKHPADKLHDLHFRINWPVASKTDSTLRLNRITTWSVVQIQLQVFTPDAVNPAAFSDDITHALRLELDHNTDVKHATAFDAALLAPIYRELADLALENAILGEVL
ncbi:hypothetical protein ACE10Z_24315 [Bradyrhizobium sp. Pha-3]|uniref:hypothetical protein n=1 Tax=Bradyrhizobium sp. Pha-3 TaxID=208375 RepID=UPI0035D433C1